jgi:hypothetical protein
MKFSLVMGSPFLVKHGAMKVKIADLDNDGAKDIVVSSDLEKYVSVLMAKP